MNHQTRLSELLCPFPSRVSPVADIVNTANLEWVDRFRFVDPGRAMTQYERMGIGWLAGRYHPDAPPADLQLITDWCGWMFYLDDVCDHAPLNTKPDAVANLFAQYFTVLQGATPASDDSPMLIALHDLYRRTRQRLSQPMLRRFVRRVREHFDGIVYEVRNRAQGWTPDVATYVRMRPITGGMHIDSLFMDMVRGGVGLPQEVLDHPIVRLLSLASMNVVCWCNDLYSLEKEMRQGDLHNLVLSLRESNQIELDTAIDRAITMHNDEVRIFIDLTDRRPSFTSVIDRHLAQYIEDLQMRMRGNQDWTAQALRYRTDVTSLPAQPVIVAAQPLTVPTVRTRVPAYV